MDKLAFDNDLYIQTQSANIQERIRQFGGKLYLEFGGKLYDDYLDEESGDMADLDESYPEESYPEETQEKKEYKDADVTFKNISLINGRSSGHGLQPDTPCPQLLC